MATQTSELVRAPACTVAEAKITLCHFTVTQRRLKSRSFYMECMPLAARGIRIRYVAPARTPERHNGVDFIPLRWRSNRILRFLSTPSLLAQLLRQNAGLYHFQDPELLPLAFLLKWIFHKRIVYDVYEDFPSMALTKAWIPRLLRPIAAKAVAGAEHLAARCFDGVITADPFTLRRLARNRASRKLVFYNFPNLDFFPPPMDAPKNFDIVYRGGLSERAGTYLLLDVMRKLEAEGKSTTLLLIGYGDNDLAERNLRAQIRRLGLESSVTIRPRLEHQEMATAFSQARIGVSPLQAIPKFLLNIPVKIFEYWACGLPVIASNLAPIRPFFHSAKAGLLFPPGNSAELARCIRWMLDHPESAAKMGQHGRAAIIERFNNCSEGRKLHRFCTQIVRAS